MSNKPVRKNPKRSTLNEKPTINDIWDDQYLCMFTFKQKPICEAIIVKWAQELLQWAMTNDDALKISQWCTIKGLTTKDLWRLCERNTTIKEAHIQAKQILGDRREIGAMKNKYNASMVQFMMPSYDPEWKAQVEWKAKMAKQDELLNGGTKVVIMERYKDE